MIRGGDFSMLKVWVGLEARSFLQASIDSVSTAHSDLEFFADNIRWNDVSSMISYRPTYSLELRNGTSANIGLSTLYLD